MSSVLHLRDVSGWPPPVAFSLQLLAAAERLRVRDAALPPPPADEWVELDASAGRTMPEGGTETPPARSSPIVGTSGDRSEVQQTPDLLDPAGLAAALDVSRAVVHRWTSEGRIPHYKLGHKTVRYRLDEVLASTAQGTAAGKRQTHGRKKARKRMDGGLPVRRAGVPRDDSIPAFDWTRTDEKGG